MPSHGRLILRRFELNVFKQIGNKPINSIGTSVLVAIVKKIEFGENSVLGMTKRACSSCGQIFRLVEATAFGVLGSNCSEVRIGGKIYVNEMMLFDETLFDCIIMLKIRKVAVCRYAAVRLC